MTAPATREQVKRWREMAERFNTALAALRDPKAGDAASEEYFAALGELTMTAPTAIPAMARMIEEREAEKNEALAIAERVISENEKLRETLRALVLLKAYKETHGATEFYERSKVTAWEQARAALGRGG